VAGPSGIRSKGRASKRWLVCIEEDLRIISVTEFGKTAGRQDRTE